MKPIDAYKFCIRCGSPLKKQKNSFICTNCGHKQYINPNPSNGALIENEKGEIMLVQRKVDPMKDYWDTPGGFIDAYEDLDTSVKRELREELGVEVKITKIIGVYNDTYLFEGLEYPTLCVMVAVKIVSGALKASDDIKGFRFFKRSEILQQKIAFPTIIQGIKEYLAMEK